MTNLQLPRPSNLDPRFGTTVSGDVYNIGDRLREVDPSLFIAFHEGATKPYAVVEKCRDGVDRVVFLTEKLDGRTVEKCQYLLNVPFAERLKIAERIVDQNDEAEKQRKSDEMFEKVGLPMQRMLYASEPGMTRHMSYPLKGVTGGKGSKAKS